MGKSSTSFKKGKSGNPKGRPPRKTEQAYLNATVNGVTMAAWGRVVSRAVEDAEDGDAKARAWLSGYLLGQPTQRTELTGADGGGISFVVTLDDN